MNNNEESLKDHFDEDDSRLIYTYYSSPEENLLIRNVKSREDNTDLGFEYYDRKSEKWVTSDINYDTELFTLKETNYIIKRDP